MKNGSGDAAEMAIARGSFRLGVFNSREMEWGLERALNVMRASASELGECFVAISNCRDGDANSWVAAWSNLAKKVEALGEQSFSAGHNESARECFLRASTYYRTAEYLCTTDNPDFHDLYFRGAKLFERAAALFPSPMRKVHVSFEGCDLPGYFWRPKDDNVKRPTLFLVGGNDSWIEESLLKVGTPAINRNYNVFMFEHPGHRGAVHHYPGKSIKRSDYEKPYKAAFDLLETLPGVDKRICLNGYSHGGYVSTRVACFEPRVAALVPSSPIHDLMAVNRMFLKPVMDRIPKDMDVDQGFDRFFPSSDPFGAFVRYSFWTANLTNVSEFWAWLAKDPPIITEYLDNIKCPTLSLCGEGEGEVLVRQAYEFHEQIGAKNKKIHEFTLDNDMSDDHCQNDNKSRMCQVMFDWLDEIFGV